MIKLRTLAAALALVCALSAQALPATVNGFAVGWNVGWIDGKFGRDLSSGFNEADWHRVFRRVREGGGSVARVWLFEKDQGIRWDLHRPTGVDPTFLWNVRRVADVAADEGVKIYWTAFDGNAPLYVGRDNDESYRYYNVLNDKYGYGDAFRANVLAPVLDAIRARRESVYAFDLMNEVEGSVSTWFWTDGWKGARRFVRTTAIFAHSIAPEIPITASAGWTAGRVDLLLGRFDGLGLDFFDVHIYTDSARIPLGASLAAHARARGVPIVLGEFGQKTKRVDPALQSRVTRGVLADALSLGFAGALAWRLEDAQPGGRHFSFFDGDVPRPAYADVRRFASSVTPPR